MQVVVVQSKAHEDDLYAEFFFQYRTDRNTSTSTNRYRYLSKSGLDRLGCCLVTLAVNRGHIGFAAMVFKSMNSNRCRSDLFKMAEQHISDPARRLIRYQPCGDLGCSF